MTDALQYHPAADIFPLLEGEEYEALKRDIQANGQVEPIYLYDGMILDGRNRYRACTELGITLKTKPYIGNSPVAFVLSLNLARRHLNASQLACAALTAMPMLEAEAKERQAEHAGTAPGKSANTCGTISTSESGKARDEAAKQFGVNPHYIQDAKKLQAQEPELLEQVRKGTLTIPQARQQVARQRTNAPAITPAMPTGKYRCIVLDPPWPMQKIEREKFPDQGLELDYPVMSLDEIAALPVADLAEPDGCHVYLWVTQKYLPDGLRLFDGWGVRYQCVMTWVKNVGFTPFSWMYSTEHVLFGRIGHLDLLRLGMRLDFSAPRTVHSAKPDVFYNTVREASPSPRLEMFARQPREGFAVWGNQVA
jgi:N6-adenosine-specific RNA methylase IME4